MIDLQNLDSDEMEIFMDERAHKDDLRAVIISLDKRTTEFKELLAITIKEVLSW